MTDLEHTLLAPAVEPLDGALFEEGGVTLSVQREFGTSAVQHQSHVEILLDSWRGGNTGKFVDSGVYRCHTAKIYHTLVPGIPLKVNTVVTSMGRIQQCCDYYTKAIMVNILWSGLFTTSVHEQFNCSVHL